MNIIVTGASKGIGKAITEKYAADKTNKLLICARNEEVLQALKASSANNNIEVFSCDMSDKQQVLAFAEWCLGLGTPSIIINNAGSFIPGNIHEEPEGAIEKMIETNLYSAYHLTKKLLPAMMEAKAGHIFNMCSTASLEAYTAGGSYSISKYALAGFTKNLRKELQSYNIKVTGIYPGAVFTDSWAGSGVSEERIMQSKDIADMVYATSKLSAQACVEDIVLRPQLGDL